MVLVCEQNYEDEYQYHQQENFIDLVVKKPIRQDEGNSLMIEHDGIHH